VIVNEVRWQQRFQNFEHALASLTRGLVQTRYNELEKQGLIQAFEYCYELAWKTLQDIILERGFVDVAEPRPVLQKAFELGLVSEGHLWMNMIKSRNATTHAYDEKKADEVIVLIRNSYHSLFVDLSKKLNEEKRK
jgi:nucleotidyltransferase substrate binding protein (TIGR01987 family)